MLSKLKDIFINLNEFITNDNLVFDEPKNQEFDLATNIAMVISKNVGKKTLWCRLWYCRKTKKTAI